MSTQLTVNGTIYNYPEQGDSDWGADASNWAQAVTNSLIPQTGGTFTLTGELDFGPVHGVKTLYIKTQTNAPSTTGVVRLANTDTIGWRNSTNTSNLTLGVGADNVLDFNGQDVITSTQTQTLTNKTLSNPVITNPNLSFTANPNTLVWSQASTGILGGFASLTANSVITTTSGSIPQCVNYLQIYNGGTNNPTLSVTANKVAFTDGAKLVTSDTPNLTNQTIQYTGTTVDWGKVLDVEVTKAATAPSSPIEGDMWFDTTAKVMKVYSGVGWESAGAVDGLTDLSDVVIGTPSTGDVLKWNGTTWVNGPDVSSGSPAWGTITGTLSSQTDLQTALNGKQAIDADLTAIAALVGTTGFLKKTAANTWTLDTSTFSPSTHDHSGVYEPINANIQTHIASLTNPHNVTKAQVGLGNVDNTADADKPISTAVQSALNAKSETSHTHTLDNLSDVIITTPTHGQALMYNSAGGNWVNGSASATTWGSIGGTLSNQTDLQSALNGKQPIDADLTAIAALAGTTGFLKKTGTDSWTLDTNSYSLSSHNHNGVYEVANANIQSHISATSNPHNVTKAQIGLGNVNNILINSAGSTAPTVNDDSGDGYSIGSRWIDTTNDNEYVCTDTTVGAAVWKQTTPVAASAETNRLSGIDTKTGDYTLILTDENKMITMNVTVDNTLTVPPNSSVAYPVGTTIHIAQAGIGQTTIVPGVGVTVNSPETLKLKKQHATASLLKVATNEWILAGYLEIA